MSISAIRAAAAALFATAVLLLGPVGITRAASLDTLRQASLELVNSDRAAHGLPPLRLSDTLNRAAQVHAKDMLAKGYFSHVSPSGGTPTGRFLAAGGNREQVLRENIAHCKGCRQPADTKGVADLETGWMHSPGHRENILAKGITFYGFGLAENPAGGRYAVQDFAGPGVLQSANKAVGKPMADASRQTALAVSIINGLRNGGIPVAAAPALYEAARTSIPEKAITPSLVRNIDPLHSLPSTVPWRRYRMLFGSCGGCGTEVTSADVTAFVERWKKNRQYRAILADQTLGAAGLAVVADGDGGKIAVAILAGD